MYAATTTSWLRKVRMAQGIVLALGAPLGWLGIRLFQGAAPLAECTNNLGLYLYMWIGTTVALGGYGFLVGYHEDSVEKENERRLARMQSDADFRNRYSQYAIEKEHAESVAIRKEAKRISERYVELPEDIVGYANRLHSYSGQLQVYKQQLSDQHDKLQKIELEVLLERAEVSRQHAEHERRQARFEVKLNNLEKHSLPEVEALIREARSARGPELHKTT